MGRMAFPAASSMCSPKRLLSVCETGASIIGTAGVAPLLELPFDITPGTAVMGLTADREAPGRFPKVPHKVQ